MRLRPPPRTGQGKKKGVHYEVGAEISYGERIDVGKNTRDIGSHVGDKNAH